MAGLAALNMFNSEAMGSLQLGSANVCISQASISKSTSKCSPHQVLDESVYTLHKYTLKTIQGEGKGVSALCKEEVLTLDLMSRAETSRLFSSKNAKYSLTAAPGVVSSPCLISQ